MRHGSGCDGCQAYFPEGHYALYAFAGDKAVYEKLSDHAGDANNAPKRAVNWVGAKELAVAAGAQIVEESARKSLKTEYKKFLQSAEDRGSMGAVEVYKLAVDGLPS